MDKTNSDKINTDKFSTGKTGTDKADTDKVVTNKTGTDQVTRETPDEELLVLEPHPEANSVKDIIKTQNAKAAGLPFKKRAEHFWYYYKVPVFVTLGILAFAAYLVLHYTVFKPKPYAFIGYALNSYNVKDITSDEELPVDIFLSGFSEYEHFDLNKNRAEINTDFTINPERADNIDIALDANLVASGQAGDVDVLMGPENLIDYYIPSGFYADTIDTYLPEDFYRYLSERNLIYYYTDENGVKYAIGIYCDSAARMDETGLYPEETGIRPVISIVSSFTPRLDTSVDFIEYLFDYPACIGNENSNAPAETE